MAQVAEALVISESGLRRWVAQDDIDAGRKEGLWSSEREGVGQAPSAEPATRDMEIDPQGRLRVDRAGERGPKIEFRLVRGLADDGFYVAVAAGS